MYAALMATMLLGGLWHGAAWHFVIWGLFHGALLILFRLEPISRIWALVPSVFAVPIFFQLTAIGWLLFRAPSLSDAATYAHTVLSGVDLAGVPWIDAAWLLGCAIPLMAFEIYVHRRNDHLEAWLYWPRLARVLFFSASILAIIYLKPPEITAFIYFQF